MGISAIVLTKNSEATIQDCLESVSQNNPEEIIVVDGYSTDRTLDVVRQYTDKIYFEEEKGLTYARQLGAEMATEEYIFYVDSDVILPPDTLETMLSELRVKGYGAMTARTLAGGGPGYLAWAVSRYKNVINPERPGEKKATIPMKATIFPRELVLKYKFDLSMQLWDDASISYRLIENGYKLAVSSAYVHHRHPTDKMGRSAYRGGFAIAESFLKYWKSPTLLIRYTLLRGLGSPIHGLAWSIAKGDLRLVPYFVYVFLGQSVGFISRLLSVFLPSLRRPKS